MDKNQRVGRRAFVLYRGGVAGEAPIDDQSQGDPVEIVLGVGELPKGMDDAFLAMEVGEERVVDIPCELAYGAHDSDGLQTYPRTYADGFASLAVGDVVSWTNPVSGRPIPVRVVKADDQLVTLDFNHPFAGKDLTYWLKLVSIE